MLLTIPTEPDGSVVVFADLATTARCDMRAVGKCNPYAILDRSPGLIGRGMNLLLN